MASTPTRLSTYAGYRTFPPNTDLSTSTLDRTAKRQGDYYLLDLNRTISHTTSSASAFACHAESSSFAFCAGSTAVLNHVGDDFTIKQKHFHASASSIGTGAVIDTDLHSASPIDKRGHGFTSPKTMPNSSPSFLAGKKGSASVADHSQKPRSATCLALSPDGRYLAVGETGHSPRILLYGVTPEANKNPISVAMEHTFAIRHLSFSPDSRSLISIGDIHDGFVHHWSLGIRTGGLRLQASNKCIASVNDCGWMGIENFITVGTRNAKIWRPEVPVSSSPTKTRFRQDTGAGSTPSSPASKGLAGRNVVLGSLIDATFTSLKAISDCSAVVGSDNGDICLLSSDAGTNKFQKIFNAGESIKGITTDRWGFLWVICQSGALWKIALARIDNNTAEDLWQNISQLSHTPLVIANFRSGLLTMDTTRRIYYYNLHLVEADSHLLSLGKEIRSHSSPVVGIGMFQDSSTGITFFTYDTAGCVLFWNSLGHLIRIGETDLDQIHPLREHDINELRVLRASASLDCFAVGYKHGQLSLLDNEMRVDYCVHAHQSDINDLVLQDIGDHGTIIASAGRDHMVQIHRVIDSNLRLIQTLNHHGSAVNKLCFLNEEATLLSLSSDRTIVFSTLMTKGDSLAFVNLRILAFKQSPIAMAISSGKSESLIVTTADKQLYKYEASTGQLETCLRTSDGQIPITVDAVVVRKGATGEQHDLIIGYSSTDRSIRVQDAENGTTIAKAFGHFGSISDICVLDEGWCSSSGIKMVTCSLDGSVMLWELSNPEATGNADREANQGWKHNRPDTPSRKILSKSSLTDFLPFVDAARHIKTPPRGGSPMRPTTATSTRSRSRSPKKPATSLSAEESKDITDINLALGGSRSMLNQGQGFPSIKELEHSVPSPISNRRLEDVLQNLYSLKEDLNGDSQKFEPGTLVDVQNELKYVLGAIDNWFSRHGS